jgi:hypothetical protein
MKLYLTVIAMTVIGLAVIGLTASCDLMNKQPAANAANTAAAKTSNSPSDSSQTNGDGQVFTAQVNGQPFTGKNIHATVTAVGGKTFFNITAFSHDINYTGANKDEKIGFNVEGEVKPGDFPFGEMGKFSDMHSHGAYNSGSPDNDMAPENSYSINGGKLSIAGYDEKTKTASGTFELTAANKDGKIVKIENGKFSHIAF